VKLSIQGKNQPNDSNFAQQRIETLMPRLTEKRAMILLFFFGIIFCPIGQYIMHINKDVYESTKIYDGSDVDVSGCKIDDPNAGTTCTVTFKFDKDVDGPVYVYYQLRNFYQNHRRYVSSKHNGQLMGEKLTKADVELSCSPLVEVGNEVDSIKLLLNPCGLIANTFFNDEIELVGTSRTDLSGLVMSESGISLSSDADRFKQVEGFTSRTEATTDCANDDPCETGETCYVSDVGQGYCYSYPEASSTKYLYQTFPNISPIDGVTDEHFMVWMRTAGLPSFRNLYGKIHQSFNEGDTLQFQITNNFEVGSFDGTKAIILTTVGEYGGANPFLGSCFIVIGGISFFLMGVLATKLTIRWYKGNQRPE
jgi:hypothetical protein